MHHEEVLEVVHSGHTSSAGFLGEIRNWNGPVGGVRRGNGTAASLVSCSLTNARRKGVSDL